MKDEFLSFLDRIDKMLSVPAAEYVPAIQDVFKEIDHCRQRLKRERTMESHISASDSLKLMAWIKDDSPKNAADVFPAGEVRDIACALEHSGVVLELKKLRAFKNINWLQVRVITIGQIIS